MNTEWLLQYEASLRTGVFLLLLLVLGLAQRFWPCRNDAEPGWRQVRNFSLLVINSLSLRLLLPLLGISVAAWAQTHGLGLLAWMALPGWCELLMALLLLDLGIWAQHRLLHHWPLLWRLHRVHHCDTGFDLSLGVRFHPGEILLSQLWKFLLIVALGASPLAVLLFELLLSAGALYTHADLRQPPWLERFLRKLVVTPSLHRIHHSVRPEQTNSNYGTLLVWWDWLFRSYRDQPAEPEARMPIGLEHFRSSAEQRLGALLLNPFIAAGTASPPAPTSDEP